MPAIRPAPPTDWQAEAFRVFCGTLRADPMLAARNLTWAIWGGDPADPSPRNPSEHELPFIRLTLLGGGRAERQSSDGTFTTYRIPLVIQVSTLVSGHSVAEATALANMIYGALWPNPAGLDADDPYRAELVAARVAIDARWRSVGVSDVLLRTPILPSDYYSLSIASEGEVELWQFLHF